MNDIYINSIQHISAQEPLSHQWFQAPLIPKEPYVRAIDPDFKTLLDPRVTRRLGRILKRALTTSKKVMEENLSFIPGAIITATGLGCIESTEIFLDKLVREGEQLLNPTQFMQSTHNTIGSLIAIETHCHSYNTTYAHQGISFECALEDAFMQLKNHTITDALVGAHDEMTPTYFQLLKKAGYLGQAGQVFAGETAVSLFLSTRPSSSPLCKIERVEQRYLPDMDLNLNLQDIDYVMTGMNQVEADDGSCRARCASLFPGVPLLRYKHVFGESYTAPAFAVYAAALCLRNRLVPGFLHVEPIPEEGCRPPRKILCYHQWANKHQTFIILSTC